MLAVYRVVSHIPTPGIDAAALSAFFKSRGDTLFGLIDMFSGGALGRCPWWLWGSCPTSAPPSFWSF